MLLTCIKSGHNEPTYDTPSLTGYLCNATNASTNFDRKNLCYSKPSTKTMQVIKVEESTLLNGFKCSKKATSLPFVCGIWSYAKLFKPLDIQIDEKITVPECKRMLKKQLFKTGYNIDIHTEMGTKVQYGEVRHGATGTRGPDHTVFCEPRGMDFEQGQEHLDWAEELTTVEIMIEPVKLTQEKGNYYYGDAKLEVDDTYWWEGVNHFAGSDSWAHGATLKNESFLILPTPVSYTNLGQRTFMEIGNMVIDKQSGHALKIYNQTIINIGGKKKLTQTDISELFLYEGKLKLPPGKLSCELELRLSKQYFNAMEEMIVMEQELARRCSKMVHFENEILSVHKGDILELTQCIEVKVKAKETTRCYANGISVEEYHGKNFLLSDMAILATDREALEVNCSSNDIPTLKLTNGKWARFSPKMEIKQIKAHTISSFMNKIHWLGKGGVLYPKTNRSTQDDIKRHTHRFNAVYHIEDLMCYKHAYCNRSTNSADGKNTFWNILNEIPEEIEKDVDYVAHVLHFGPAIATGFFLFCMVILLYITYKWMRKIKSKMSEDTSVDRLSHRKNTVVEEMEMNPFYE